MSEELRIKMRAVMPVVDFLEMRRKRVISAKTFRLCDSGNCGELKSFATFDRIFILCQTPNLS